MYNLSWLPAKAEAAGLTVVVEPGFDTRGSTWNNDRPAGGMIHHTAPPVPYPPDGMYRDGRIKANVFIQDDGTVHMVSSYACNYSSGMGSSVVLRETQREQAPTGTAHSRGLEDDIGGNFYYVNMEVAHPGDGSPLGVEAQEAIVTVWALICDNLNWDPNRLIAHAEWSRRKIDPAWNGLDAHRNAVLLRSVVRDRLNDMGGITKEQLDAAVANVLKAIEKSERRVLKTLITADTTGVVQQGILTDEQHATLQERVDINRNGSPDVAPPEDPSDGAP